MSTLAERFAAAVDVAMELDTPSQILRRILADPVDDGLRSASLDGKIRGGSPESHPERMADMPARRVGGRHVADAIELSRTSTAAVEAALSLLDICLHRSPEADDYGWADAVKDMHLLAEMDVVSAALDVDYDRSANRWTEAWCTAMEGYRDVCRRWPAKTGRRPTSIEAAWTSDLADEDCCRVCLTIEPWGTVRVRRRRKRRGLCWKCEEIERTTGAEPSPALMAVWHESDRGGQPRLWDVAWTRWTESIEAGVS